jgi:Transcription termination factor nusG
LKVKALPPTAGLCSEAPGYWFCLTVKPDPNSHWRAKVGIESALIPVFCPIERVQSKQLNGQVCWTVKPMLMGYLFAKAPPDRIDDLLKIDGVVDVLRTHEKKPAVIRAEFLEEFCRFNHLVNSVASLKQAAAKLKVGDDVGLTDEAFRGFVFKLASARPKDRRELVLKHGLQPGTIIVSADRLERLAAA